MDVGIVHSEFVQDARVWRNGSEDKVRVEVGGLTLFLTDAAALELAEALRVQVLVREAVSG